MKKIFFALIVIVFVAGIALIFSGLNNDNSAESHEDNNVYLVDGKQIIEINAKGGYWPRTSSARADTPTIIKLKTRGTFDCSSAITIPSLNYRTILSPSGETLVDVPPQKKGTELSGSCSMGMYNFSITFD